MGTVGRGFTDTSQPEVWHKPSLGLSGGERLRELGGNSEFAALDHGLLVVPPKISCIACSPPWPGEGVLL